MEITKKFKKEIEIALIKKAKKKGDLAALLQMKRETFWAKMNNRANYAPFTQPQVHNIKKFLGLK